MTAKSYLIYTADDAILGNLDEIYKADNKTHITRESPINYRLKEKQKFIFL